MKKKQRMLRSITALLLCAAMVLPLVGCKEIDEEPTEVENQEEILEQAIPEENRLSVDAVYQILDTTGESYGSYTFYAAKTDADQLDADLTYIVENCVVCQPITSAEPQAIDLDAGVYAVAFVDNANHENRAIRIIWVKESGGADALTVETDWEKSDTTQSEQPEEPVEQEDSKSESKPESKPEKPDASVVLSDWYVEDCDKTNLEIAVLADVTRDGSPELITVHWDQDTTLIEGYVYTVTQSGEVEKIETISGGESHVSGFFGWYLKKAETGYDLIQETFGMWQGYGEVDVTEYYLDADGNRTTVQRAGAASEADAPVSDAVWNDYISDGKDILDGASVLCQTASNITADLAPMDESLCLIQDEKEQSEDATARPTAADGYVHSHPLGTTVSYDLNGDGKAEEITVTAAEWSATVTVNGVSEETEQYFENATGYFTVICPDESKDTLLIGVSQYGPSDDPRTDLYSYDGAKLCYAGCFDSILGENEWGSLTATCNGDGTISANTRMDVLGTWGATALYAVDGESVADVTEFYKYIAYDGSTTGWKATTLCDIIVYAERNITGEETVVPTGTELYMIGCSYAGVNAYWVKFESDAFDQAMWAFVELENGIYPTYVQTPQGSVESVNVFDGFHYAG